MIRTSMINCFGRFFANPIMFFVKNRSLLLSSLVSEVKTRNAGTVLGTWWTILTPVLTFALYSFLYAAVLKVRIPDMPTSHYLLHMFSGLAVFLCFSEGISSGTASLMANKSVLKITVFPLILIPAKQLGNVIVGFAVSLSVLAIASFLLKLASVRILLLPLFALLEFAFILGIVWITSVISLFIKDVQTLIGFLLTTLMLASPISYSIKMVPKMLQILVWANPFSHFVIVAQATFNAAVPFPYIHLGIATVLSISMFYSGFYFYNRAVRVAANYA